ncbi:MAG: tryptophan synthase subunit alpha [Bacillota bacterium]|nr:tryptophan synthase subunit alpha [Bacillota bacterium]
MNRIDRVFSRLKEENRKALITFITSGDPSLDATGEIILSMDKAGADIIEVGIPYSDPLADGPVIQNSYARALKNGVKIKSVIDKIAETRLKTEVPLVFMVYYSCIYKYGADKFVRNCHAAGIDGIIIPDLPLEERVEIRNICDSYDIYLIPLVAPASKDRIKEVVEDAKGFVYCVSVNGVTGMRQALATDLESYMKVVSKYTGVPKALGFGISNKEMAEKYKPFCDGVIIGSAIVDIISQEPGITDSTDKLRRFVKEVREALDK